MESITNLFLNFETQIYLIVFLALTILCGFKNKISHLKFDIFGAIIYAILLINVLLNGFAKGF